MPIHHHHRCLPRTLTATVALMTAIGTAAEPLAVFDAHAINRRGTTAMHEPVEEPIRVRVGHADEPAGETPHDFSGRDGRVIQAAVDFAAHCRTGSTRPVVEVGPGRYRLRDSVHVRSGVEIRGVPGRTILAVRPAVSSPLLVDGDYGEEQITLAAPEGFAVGDGVLVEADNVRFFHVTVARIVGRSGNRFVLDQPLRADCQVKQHARATTVFPAISICHAEQAHLEGLVIDGGGRDGPPIDNCRGAGIYLLRAHGTTIRNCEIRRFPGDGLSYQQSNDVSVFDTVSIVNAGHGFHPGSGSQRTVLTRCRAEDNGLDGMFICWRVQHGRFEHSVFSGNARNGVSLGHKDTDNLLASNSVRGNGREGILFRDEPANMAANRNRIIGNTIENNGATADGPVAGIRIRGATSGNEIRDNRLRDTRSGPDRRQTIGILLEPEAGENGLEGNENLADEPVRDDRR